MNKQSRLLRCREALMLAGQDMICAQAGRSRATLKLARRSNGRKGYRGTITLGVAT
jgi:hypothetical protein